ncbi:MAG: branched-chain amino acid transaminase [Pseudomonadota bacterium]
MSMSDRDGQIWFDGELVPWRDANVHILTHTLHYGMGVFEGVRAYETESGTAIFRLQDHTDRLFESAKIVGLKIPYDKKTLNQAQRSVVKNNELKSAYIRPICFYGSEGMGLRADNLKVHCAIAAWEWGTYLGKENIEKGIKIKTSSYTRHFVKEDMCKAKINGNYVLSMLALEEALKAGYDEALLLDIDGYVAEGSGENIFVIKDNAIYTPTLTAALNGVTRRTVFELADSIGLKVLEKQIDIKEVEDADEAFFTGTAAEVTPIRKLDDKKVGDGKRGPVTKKLQELYFNVVHGKNMQYMKWLNFIE